MRRQKKYHLGKKMTSQLRMILILQVSFHGVYGNKMGPTGIYEAPDFLNNLRFHYGGGSGRLPAVPNSLGTRNQFPGR